MHLHHYWRHCLPASITNCVIAEGCEPLFKYIDIIAGAASQAIVAKPSAQGIIAVAADNDIIAIAAVKQVIAGHTVQCVVAGPADEAVIAGPADNVVVAGPAVNGVAFVISNYSVVTLTAKEIFDAGYFCFGAVSCRW